MERRAAARAERLRFRAAIERVRAITGLEKRKVADLLDVRQDALSKMAAESVPKQETLVPPDGWRRTLAGKLLGQLVRDAEKAAQEISEWPGPDDDSPSPAQEVTAPPPPPPAAAHRRPFSKEEQTRRGRKGP